MKLLAVIATTHALSTPTRLPALAADKQLKTIFENNRKWVQEEVKKDKDYFNRMASGQSPQILWIGCSDSRVPANRIMGLDAGDVFVARNVANQVIGTDMSMMSVIQYAVNVLKVPHIVICGHYDCGGVKASMENVDHVPPLENWLRNIRDTYRLNRQELDRISDKDQRTRRLVELNTLEQAFAVFKTGVVQRRRVQTYGSDQEPYTQPRIHAVVFDPGTGELKELNVNWKQELDKLGPIYNLYAPETAEARAERLGDGGAAAAAPPPVETPKKKGLWGRLRG